MTAEQFAYWMQGFAELNGDAAPSKAQWKMMREPLQTVFTKVTPPLDMTRFPPAIPYTWEQSTGSPLIATCSSSDAAQTYC